MLIKGLLLRGSLLGNALPQPVGLVTLIVTARLLPEPAKHAVKLTQLHLHKADPTLDLGDLLLTDFALLHQLHLRTLKLPSPPPPELS